MLNGGKHFIKKPCFLVKHKVIPRNDKVTLQPTIFTEFNYNSKYASTSNVQVHQSTSDFFFLPHICYIICEHVQVTLI